MGQRHQAIIAYHQHEYGAPKASPVKYMAFHNQWCYGSLPLRHTYRFARFQKTGDEYGRISNQDTRDGAEKFKALLGLDLDAGFFAPTLDITQEATTPSGQINPDTFDNNDGITLIYVPPKAKRIKYCFMNINVSAYEDDPAGIPLDAREYARKYYPEGDKKWVEHGVEKLARYLEKNAELLSLDECKALLPDWYKSHISSALASGIKDVCSWTACIERDAILKATKDQLPLYLGKCHPINVKVLEQRMKGR